MNPFQQLLNAVRSGYQKADERLGGWLPGGGVASPLTRAKQEGEKQLAERIKQRQSEYVGQPGRFAGQGQLLNAIRATTQAGTNPVSVALGDKTALQKLSGYYSQYPSLQNEFDLNTNLFLRYISGTGAEGLKVSPEVGKQIYADIKQQEKTFMNPDYREKVLNFLGGSGVPSYLKENLLRGNTPVYYGGSKEAIAPVETQLPTDVGQRWQLQHSLGSYWAQPTKDDSYQIKGERYNFNYAPMGKEGIKAAQNLSILDNPYMLAPISPTGAGRNIVRQGYGTPYQYSLNIDPFGNVKTTP